MKPTVSPSVSFSELLNPLAAKQMIAGAVVGVGDAKGVLSLEAAGSADIAGGKAMSPDALFWIASMSKPITGVAVMMLVDQGKIALDDPVTKYIPEFKHLWQCVYGTADCVLLRKPERPPTIREMMCHCSGMAFSAAVEWPLDIMPLAEAARVYALTPLASAPGTKYAYSNMGINTCGRIIEIVTGERYEDFVENHLCKPLGMKDTTLWPSKKQLERLAKAYGPNPEKNALVDTGFTHLTKPYDDRERRFPMPGGGYFSTASDMLRFGRMLLNDGELDGKRYLSVAAMGEIKRKQTPQAVTENYSVGFTADPDTFGHGGALSTNLRVSPLHGITTVFLVQHTGFINDGGGALGTFWTAATEKLGKKKA
ncbi:MAG: serine hydrolase [Planctomycetota bacterium]|nr:serine hydrolase [Planctomycetota bacterium]